METVNYLASWNLIHYPCLNIELTSWQENHDHEKPDAVKKSVLITGINSHVEWDWVPYELLGALYKYFQQFLLQQSLLSA